MAVQPFYHQASVLFTATREVDRDELTEALKKLKIPGVAARSIECEDVSAEPGDPADQ
jgi:hypothetical protein